MKMLERCRKAEILDEGGNVLCSAAVSTDVMDGLLLTVPNTFDYQAQDAYTVVFYDPTLGLLTCRCALFARLDLPEQLRSLRCEILQRLSQDQRRMDLKVPLQDVKAQVRRSGSDGESVAFLDNISAGGVYLRTALRAEAGDHLHFTFREAGEPLALTAEVLRVVPPKEKDRVPLYGYGCRFVRLPARHENQLRNFVFQQEKRLYKRNW